MYFNICLSGVSKIFLLWIGYTTSFYWISGLAICSDMTIPFLLFMHQIKRVKLSLFCNWLMHFLIYTPLFYKGYVWYPVSLAHISTHKILGLGCLRFRCFNLLFGCKKKHPPTPWPTLAGAGQNPEEDLAHLDLQDAEQHWGQGNPVSHIWLSWTASAEQAWKHNVVFPWVNSDTPYPCLQFQPVVWMAAHTAKYQREWLQNKRSD